MITLGVDLASQPADTAACRVRWREAVAEVDEPELGLDNDRLLELFGDADKIGIDSPFGWPDPFVEALCSYRDGGPWPPYSLAQLRFRETDRHVRRLTGKQPLSPSTGWLLFVTLRAARLLSRVGERIDRSGRGRFVEVYPAAALRRWGLRPTDFLATPPLRLPTRVRTACEASPHALEALIAAVIARAAALGLCEPIPRGKIRIATREGWIALPKPGTLEQLI